MPQLRIPAVYMRGGTSKGVFLAPSRRDGCDVDYLLGPGVGRVEATLITAGNPTVFVSAASEGWIRVPAI